MQCARDPEAIAALLDGELAPADQVELEAHVAGCAACRELVASQRRLARALAALPAVEPPPDFEARFWARIARERDAAPSGLRARLRALFPPLPLAVAAIALALLLAVPRGEKGPPPLPEQDVPIVRSQADFELVQDPDLDTISEVDVLENWDDAPPG